MGRRSIDGEAIAKFCEGGKTARDVADAFFNGNSSAATNWCRKHGVDILKGVRGEYGSTVEARRIIAEAGGWMYFSDFYRAMKFAARKSAIRFVQNHKLNVVIRGDEGEIV